jgi:hypothetical protein
MDRAWIRRRLTAVAGHALLAGFLLPGCGDDGSSGPSARSRTYYMGFSGIPPRPDFPIAIAAINTWIPRADAALVFIGAPWESLLAGARPDSVIRRDPLPIAEYYRSRGLKLVVAVDPTNGLDRASDAPGLVAAGRRLTEPEIQQLFLEYCVATDTLLRPDYLCIAVETNLIRAAAPAALYDAVVQTANATAAAVRAVDPNVRLFSSVQVETAWGALGGSGGYVGIDVDRADFSFNQLLGLSSYPYLGGYAEPEDLPDDYYSRLVEGAPLPVMVIEGGWSSDTVGAIPSTPEKQRRYIARHAQLLDRAGAIGFFQITFTDLDPAFFPPGTILPLFAYLGLVDANLAPKPALTEWDRIFARPRR